MVIWQSFSGITKFARSTLFGILCICLLMSGGHSGHFLLMNVPANHGVEAQISQWLPCKGRWPNEKIYLAGVIIFENCNKS